MIIVVTGLIGICGSGGQAWAYMQYLAGLRDLGHDVYYLEDCPECSKIAVWDTRQKITDIDSRAEFVGDCLKLIRLEDRWIIRVGDHSKGMAVSEFRDICSRDPLVAPRRPTAKCAGKPRTEAFRARLSAV